VSAVGERATVEVSRLNSFANPWKANNDCKSGLSFEMKGIDCNRKRSRRKSRAIKVRPPLSSSCGFVCGRSSFSTENEVYLQTAAKRKWVGVPGKLVEIDDKQDQ
jgi:hypothetical protein